MKYLYYPGCSLEGSAREYDVSTRALMSALGAELIELEDWTCCGASAAAAVGHYLSLALPARNLALVEKQKAKEDILVPCSACYLNLKTVEEKVKKDFNLLNDINTILAEEQLKITGRTRTRHLLDVIANDFGAKKIAPKVVRKLEGLAIAPYYGCQCLRPYTVFDDPEDPKSMEPVLEAVGADVHRWDMGSKCCGASHMNTKMDVGLELVGAILRRAKGADAVVTVCPMCQMNLEAYQKKISRMRGDDVTISILYLPQLLGWALGLSEKDLRLDLNLAVTAELRKKLRRYESRAA
jgi:heterodisulfide reductase subunit B